MENVTLHDLNVILTDILQVITDRYLKNNFTIPKDVLQFKDEAYDIIRKAAQASDDPNSEVLEGYRRRLAEIHQILRDPIGN